MRVVGVSELVLFRLNNTLTGVSAECDANSYRARLSNMSDVEMLENTDSLTVLFAVETGLKQIIGMATSDVME